MSGLNQIQARESETSDACGSKLHSLFKELIIIYAASQQDSNLLLLLKYDTIV